LKGKLSCCDISVAKTSRIYETADKLRRNITSTKLTLETANTKGGDDVRYSEPIFSCRIFLTLEIFYKRKNLTSPNVLFSCRNKKPFISKSCAYEFVYAESIYISKFAKERVKGANFAINTESKFEMPYDNLFAAAYNSGDTEAKEHKNIKILTGTAVILNIVTNQTNAISGASRCALNISVKNICLACRSASWKASVEVPAMAGFVTVLPKSICDRGLRHFMEHYFEGHCLSLHRLQQEGKLIIVTNKFGMPVTVAERSEACTVFSRSEAGNMGSNPTQGLDAWYVYMFILCLCCPVCR
jgi:hypothetical protein